MSNTTLTKSLSERVAALRAGQNTGSAPVRLPPPAARSLLVEVLLAEFAATLPAPFAARVRAADSPGTAMDWMFAGAVYRTVADDPYLARQFLAVVDADPRAAGVAMATALASKQEPAPRDASWYRRDRAGLVLQLFAAGFILLVRCLLLILLIALIHPLVPTVTLSSIMGDWVRPDLLSDGRASGLTASVLLTIASLWLGLEAVVAPQLLERLRQLPARWRALPPPLACRTDAFYVFWYVQAMIPLLIVEAVLFLFLGRMAFFDTLSLIQWAALFGLGLIGVGALGLAVSLARPTLCLGTGSSGPKSS